MVFYKMVVEFCVLEYVSFDSCNGGSYGILVGELLCYVSVIIIDKGVIIFIG